jgi:hypothetical protein
MASNKRILEVFKMKIMREGARALIDRLKGKKASIIHKER